MSENESKATDPVCGMTVDEADATHVVYEGRVYSFCDPACADIFNDDPARWVDRDGQGTFEHSH